MKQIVKNFNNLIKKTIFKVQNKTNNKSRISSFNKYLITFIGLLFLYIFYLLIPLLYDKSWIQKNIESKLLTEFKIKVSTSADISYRILPAPHFLIKNSKILLKDTKSQKSIADVKNLKVFLSQKNLFNKEKIIFKNLIIDNANFSLLRDELKTLSDHNNSQFSNKKTKINNSYIFFKDNLGEIITIIKINNAILFFDDEKQLNLFRLKGNVFGVPFSFDLKSQNNSVINKKMNLEVESLKLNIFNENNNSNTGKNIISFLNSTIKTKYDVKEKLITFISDNSKFNNSKIDYGGELSINPFDLNLNIDLGNYKISQLFSLNSILQELVKSKLLFNENLSLDVSILAKTNAREEVFQKAKINLSIINGIININNTRFINKDIGLLELRNSNLFLENNKLILNTDILIDIKNIDGLFSFLNTNKKSRKEIKNIFFNLNYDFLNNQIKFNNIKIDNNKVGDKLLTIIDDFNDNNSKNLINSRRLLNKLFDIYEG
tara:strand:+ start:181 stop:1653 length:1473 start_codon:yes stop_codon:yes gene_type:complete